MFMNLCIGHKFKNYIEGELSCIFTEFDSHEHPFEHFKRNMIVSLSRQLVSNFFVIQISPHHSFLANRYCEQICNLQSTNQIFA